MAQIRRKSREFSSNINSYEGFGVAANQSTQPRVEMKPCYRCTPQCCQNTACVKCLAFQVEKLRYQVCQMSAILFDIDLSKYVVQGGNFFGNKIVVKDIVVSDTSLFKTAMICSTEIV
jgi:hypothetical protein